MNLYDIEVRHRSRRVVTDDAPLSEIKRHVERVSRHILAYGSSRQIAMWEFAAERCLEHDNPGLIITFEQLNRFPVTIDEFVESPEFLGNQLDIWPALRVDLRAMNPDVFVGRPPINEALLGGAIGTGKTTLAQVTLLYRLYLFTCFRQPQSLFGLTPHTPIIFTLQSLSPSPWSTATRCAPNSPSSSSEPTGTESIIRREDPRMLQMPSAALSTRLHDRAPTVTPEAMSTKKAGNTERTANEHALILADPREIVE